METLKMLIAGASPETKARATEELTNLHGHLSTLRAEVARLNRLAEKPQIFNRLETMHELLRKWQLARTALLSAKRAREGANRGDASDLNAALMLAESDEWAAADRLHAVAKEWAR